MILNLIAIQTGAKHYGEQIFHADSIFWPDQVLYCARHTRFIMHRVMHSPQLDFKPTFGFQIHLKSCITKYSVLRFFYLIAYFNIPCFRYDNCTLY